jgi:hypothetical protein
MTLFCQNFSKMPDDFTPNWMYIIFISLNLAAVKVLFLDDFMRGCRQVFHAGLRQDLQSMGPATHA